MLSIWWWKTCVFFFRFFSKFASFHWQVSYKKNGRILIVIFAPLVMVVTIWLPTTSGFPRHICKQPAQPVFHRGGRGAPSGKLGQNTRRVSRVNFSTITVKPIRNPWDWYFFFPTWHGWIFYGFHVGEYTIHMDPIGHKYLEMFLLPGRSCFSLSPLMAQLNRGRIWFMSIPWSLTAGPLKMLGTGRGSFPIGAR